MMPILFTAMALGIATSGAGTMPSRPAVIRHPNAGGATTSRAVEVTPADTIIFISGQTPIPENPAAPPNTRPYWGDTEAQARAVFQKLAAVLAGLKLDPSAIVSLRVFLVSDSTTGGRPDIAGFARAYQAAFDVANGQNLPARTVVTVAAHGAPGMLVEVEAVAVRSKVSG